MKDQQLLVHEWFPSYVFLGSLWFIFQPLNSHVPIWLQFAALKHRLQHLGQSTTVCSIWPFLLLEAYANILIRIYDWDNRFCIIICFYLWFRWVKEICLYPASLWLYISLKNCSFSFWCLSLVQVFDFWNVLLVTM